MTHEAPPEVQNLLDLLEQVVTHMTLLRRGVKMEYALAPEAVKVTFRVPGEENFRRTLGTKGRNIDELRSVFRIIFRRIGYDLDLTLMRLDA